MFTQYIKILGDCSKDIINKMTNIDMVNVEIIQSEHTETTYSIAHSIQYEDLNNKLKGNFILGFADEPMAMTLASKIAKNVGLPLAEQFDETASDIIGEFLNTVVGHTITEWDRLGLKVQFDTPVMVKDTHISLNESADTEDYQVKINFSDNKEIPDSSVMSLVVTFTNIYENKLKGRRILVVDDSSVMRKIISNALEKQGIHVEQATDGKDAIDKFKDFNPDLTLMDLVMPNMGGLDAIMEIKESNPDAKFVVLTSSSRKDEIVTAKTLNVLAYIIKPLNIDELLAKIKKIFE